MIMIDQNILLKEITVDDCIKSKEELIGLIDENLKINFINLENSSEYSQKIYGDIVEFKSNGSAILLGAFNEDKIIAFIWGYIREVFGEKKIHIGHIIVSSEFRSNGIGKMLLNKMALVANEKKVRKIELITSLDNKKAVDFYENNGFSITRVQLEKEVDEKIDNK